MIKKQLMTSNTNKKTTITFASIFSLVAIASLLILFNPSSTHASLIDADVTVDLNGADMNNNVTSELNPLTRTVTEGLGPEFEWIGDGMGNCGTPAFDEGIFVDIENSQINITLTSSLGDFVACDSSGTRIDNPLIFNFTNLNWTDAAGFITGIDNSTVPALNETSTVAGPNAVDITINATEFDFEGILEFIYEIETTHAFEGNKTWTYTDYDFTDRCHNFFNGTHCVFNSTDPTVVPLETPNVNLDDDIFADSLDHDSDGTSDVHLQVKKNNRISNTNPGAFYALTTVVMSSSLSSVEVWEDYSDCTAGDPSPIKLHQKNKLDRSVKAYHIAPDGNATDISDRLNNATDLGVVFTEPVNATMAHVNFTDSDLLTEGSTVFVAVKFQDTLKNVVDDSPYECLNTETVTAKIGEVNEYSDIFEATLRLSTDPLP